MLGLGLVGLLQLVLFAVVGVVLALATDVVKLPAGELATTVAASVGWFLLGYAFFAYAYGSTGSLVSRPEDVQSVTTPVSIIAFASYFSAMFASQNLDASWVGPLSYVPPFSALGGDLDAEIQHRGGSLSGGERQRIAIARALLSRPRLLILDEATSQLDAVNEAALRELIEEVSGRITVVAVAHRLSTVMAAGQIVVMQDGKTRAMGRHEELVQSDELYHQLVSHQFGGTAPVPS